MESTKVATAKVAAKFPKKPPQYPSKVLKTPKFASSKVPKFSSSQVPKLSNSPPEDIPDPPAGDKKSTDEPTLTAPAEIQIPTPTEALVPVTTGVPPGGTPTTPKENVHDIQAKDESPEAVTPTTTEVNPTTEEKIETPAEDPAPTLHTEVQVPSTG